MPGMCMCVWPVELWLFLRCGRMAIPDLICSLDRGCHSCMNAQKQCLEQANKLLDLSSSEEGGMMDLGK